MTTKKDIYDHITWFKNHYKCNENPIFEIVLFEKPNSEMFYDDKPSGFPDTGCFDRMGFYYNLNTAIRALNENWCDIQETCYHAGFILCLFPGMYECATTNARMYFIWDNEKKGFFQQEEPEIFKHIAY